MPNDSKKAETGHTFNVVTFFPVLALKLSSQVNIGS